MPQPQIRINALELGVLGLEFARSPSLGHQHIRVLALPLVIRGVADAIRLAQLGYQFRLC